MCSLYEGQRQSRKDRLLGSRFGLCRSSRDRHFLSKYYVSRYLNSPDRTHRQRAIAKTSTTTTHSFQKYLDMCRSFISSPLRVRLSRRRKEEEEKRSMRPSGDPGELTSESGNHPSPAAHHLKLRCGQNPLINDPRVSTAGASIFGLTSSPICAPSRTYLDRCQTRWIPCIRRKLG